MNETNQDDGGVGIGCLGAILGLGLGIVHWLVTVNITNGFKGNLGNLFSLLVFVFYMVLLHRLLQKSKPAAATGLVIGAALIGLLGVGCASIVRQL